MKLEITQNDKAYLQIMRERKEPKDRPSVYGFDKEQLKNALPKKMSDVTEKIFRIAQEKGEEEFYQMYSDYFEYFINIVNKVIIKEGLSVSKSTIYYYGNPSCKNPDCKTTPLNHESCIHDIAAIIYKAHFDLDKFTPAVTPRLT